MALLRKLFARKAMDGLSRVSERVFVFNSCLSTEALLDDAHKDYLSSTIIQLKYNHPHGSILVVNFATGDEKAGKGTIDSLLQHGATAVTHYSSRYAGCPSLPLSKIRAFIGSCIQWLVSDHHRNVLLLHCEDQAAWPVLAFAMASLLLHTEEPAPERQTLDAVYARVPMELLAAGSALDPRPSHLRYLQYVTRLRGTPLKSMRQETFVLDCLILRSIPDFDGCGGCTPLIRVHGQEPLTDASPEVLFSTPRIKQHFKQYKQAESAVIKANIECQIHGDVVIECIHIGDQDREEIMFRVMFSTCFLQSNMMVFALDDIDLPWNCSREKFHKDFKIEVFFSEVELSDTDESINECEHADEFYDFDDIFINSKFNPIEQECHGETSQQDHDQEQDIETEDDEILTLDPASSSSSEETGSINNSSSDDESALIHGAHLTRESKDPRLGKASYLLEVGSTSTMQLQPVAPINEDLNIEMSNSGQENTSVKKVTHQGSQTSTQQVGEMRKTKQKQAVMIPPVPTIRKKVRKEDNESEDKPATGKMLIKVASHMGALVEAKRTPSYRQHQNTNKLGQGAAQARISNLSKEHLQNSATTTSSATAITTATFTIGKPSSSPPSPRAQELNQDDRKGSRDHLETVKKSTTLLSTKPRNGKTPKQEATIVSNVDTPHRTTVLKKSLSSPAISQTAITASAAKSGGVTSFLGVKTGHPKTGLPVASSTTSPRVRKQSVPSPSSPRGSPVVSSKVLREIVAVKPDMNKSASIPIRFLRRASLGELSHSPVFTRANNARSLSPGMSRVIQQNQQAGMKDSGTSLSPRSSRLVRAQPSPKSAATVSLSVSKDSNTSGAIPARPTRFSS